MINWKKEGFYIFFFSPVSPFFFFFPDQPENFFRSHASPKNRIFEIFCPADLLLLLFILPIMKPLINPWLLNFFPHNVLHFERIIVIPLIGYIDTRTHEAYFDFCWSGERNWFWEKKKKKKMGRFETWWNDWLIEFTQLYQFCFSLIVDTLKSWLIDWKELKTEPRNQSCPFFKKIEKSINSANFRLQRPCKDSKILQLLHASKEKFKGNWTIKSFFGN